MKPNQKRDRLEELIRASAKLEEAPSPELNKELLVRLYQRESELCRQPAHIIPLWYAPMLINGLTFLLLAALALLYVPNPYLSGLAVFVCGYLTLAGVLVTVIGAKRADIKQEITLHIKKRGVCS